MREQIDKRINISKNDREIHIVFVEPIERTASRKILTTDQRFNIRDFIEI